MKLTEDQKKLVEALLATSNGAEMYERRSTVPWSQTFYESLNEGDVQFYFNRLMLAAYHLELNRKNEADLKEARLKGRQSNVEAYMSGLLGFVRNHLPAAGVSFSSNDSVARVDVVDPAKRMHLILSFDKKRMTLKSVTTNTCYLEKTRTESLSNWDAGVAGHMQSELFKAFRHEIESVSTKR